MRELTTVKHYNDLILEIDRLSSEEKHRLCRYLCRTDLFFLLYFGCSRYDIAHQWLLDRCKEVEKNPDGYLDLWARGHYKSTIITFGKTIQDILASHGDNPLPEFEGIELTFAIFSHTRPIATKFLAQIKEELEKNQILKSLFPDILYENPHKEASKWSEEKGICVKRKSNPKEQTVEAWGVVEGQPTGIHPLRLIYDDMVTLETVTTPNMIEKSMNNFKISLNLAVEKSKKRYVGTFYHFNDPYNQMIKAGIAKKRIYPATDDGTIHGKPIFLSKEALNKKYIEMGPHVFGCQMLLNPIADSKQSFLKDWFKFYGRKMELGQANNLNKYILCDPAHTKKDSSDYTAIAVVGMGSDENYYLLDGVRDRLNPIERINLIFDMARKWKPLGVGYEGNGAKSDLHFIREQERNKNFHLRGFVELKHNMPKPERIKRLIPSISQGRWYFPDSLIFKNYEGKQIDLVDTILHDEFYLFPACPHDDFMDCLSSIFDQELNTIWPQIREESRYDRYSTQRYRATSAWAV